jgi:hypothetical protein
MNSGVVALVVVLVVATSLVLLIGWIIRLKRETATSLRKRYGAAIVLIDEAANCFGIESRGVAQVRGNGCLVATSDEVCFAMWVPRREMVIQRTDVVAVEASRSHLGKSKGTRLLKVVYTTAAGRDSVAWAIRDLDTWVRELSP